MTVGTNLLAEYGQDESEKLDFLIELCGGQAVFSSLGHLWGVEKCAKLTQDATNGRRLIEEMEVLLTKYHFTIQIAIPDGLVHIKRQDDKNEVMLWTLEQMESAYENVERAETSLHHPTRFWMPASTSISSREKWNSK